MTYFTRTDFLKSRRNLVNYERTLILKIQIGYENYLSQIQNIQVRVSLTKFRLSNHRLMIETGRHQRIDKNLRFCPFCPRKIEDEFHFLLECQIFRTIRDEVFAKAERDLGSFSRLRKSEKFITLLSNPAVSHTANYIFRAFAIREYLVSKHKNHT